MENQNKLDGIRTMNKYGKLTKDILRNSELYLKRLKE